MKTKKVNRLLINMLNKVEVIEGAIDQCERLIKNETIVLNGLHTLHVTKGDISDDWFLNRISELKSEKQNLKNRIYRMGY